MLKKLLRLFLLVKAKGFLQNIENIVTEATALFEEMKNFDIDAAIMSKEWNGTVFEEYEK